MLNDPLQSCAADNSGDGNAGHVVQPPSSPNNSGQNQDTETCKDVREENVDEQANKQVNFLLYIQVRVPRQFKIVIGLKALTLSILKDTRQQKE